MKRVMTLRKLGIVSFTFFAIKGCVWLVIALVVTTGLIDAPVQ